MRIEIQARKVSLPRRLRSHIERRIRGALTRFDERITRVSMWLSAGNGPGGGAGKHCQMQIVMPGRSDVVIDETRETLHVAINRALERAGQSVVRKLDRQRRHAKGATRIIHGLPGAA